MSSLKRRAPHGLKVLGRRLSVAAGCRTARWRMLPDAVLAGAQRCGTTSLYRALITHPEVLPPVHHKGVNYFDVNYSKGPDWYRGHFPVRSAAGLRKPRAARAPVTFDASGYYVYHPLAAARLGRDLPGVKAIVMLRDPVERAWSAYRHESARGFETESFERALELEDERVEPELERMLSDPTYQSFSHRHHSYRRRGMYAEQLRRLSDAVGRDRLLVVDSTDFFSRPADEYARVVDFLGLSPHIPSRFDQWNARPGSDMSDRARAFLESRLESSDAELEAFLGRRPTWRQ